MDLLCGLLVVIRTAPNAFDVLASVCSHSKMIRAPGQSVANATEQHDASITYPGTKRTYIFHNRNRISPNGGVASSRTVAIFNTIKMTI